MQAGEEGGEQKGDLAIAMDELKYVKTMKTTNVWNRWKAQQAPYFQKRRETHIRKQLKTKKMKERVAAIDVVFNADEHL